tara:strand:+ start:2303 stop:2485 length:183 start_codon:yes stop_codon:yes gene_type:complete
MSDIEKEDKPIELNSWVRLTINNDQWVGEVVELCEGVALIRLLDNMHYHAKLDELELVTP